MRYKILEQNGVNHENVDGGAFNNFTAGGRDGIIKGVLNECAIVKVSSNIISISTGEMLIHGIRIKFEESNTFELDSYPAVPIDYRMVVDLTIDANRAVTVSIVLDAGGGTLIQEELYRTESGHYQVEIARFTHSPNGIENLTPSLEVIRGGVGSGVEIGKVTTVTVHPGTAADVSVQKRYDIAKDDFVTDFAFAIPQGPKGDNLYTFSVSNGKLLVSSEIADENAMSLKNGHLVLG